MIPPPPIIPDYTITPRDFLGEGTYGWVWRAVYKADQPRAVKVFKRKAIQEALWESEYEKLRELDEPPGIVTLYDRGRLADGTPWYAMRLMADEKGGGHWEGRTLSQAMAAGKLSDPDKWRILFELAETLAFMHRHGVVHCDIKPSNTLLSSAKEPRPVICDFGQSRSSGELEGAAFGTLYYSSPQQLEQPDRSEKHWDVYSFGVLAFELLTGKLPRLEEWRRQPAQSQLGTLSFAGDAASIESSAKGVAVAAERLRAEAVVTPPAQAALPERSEEWQVLLQCLALEVAERPTNMEAVWTRLAACAQQRLRKAERRKRLIYAGLAGLAACGAVLSTLLWRDATSAKSLAEKRLVDVEAEKRVSETQRQAAELNAEAAQLVNLAESAPEEALLRAIVVVDRSRKLLKTVPPAVEYSLAAALERHRMLGVLPLPNTPHRLAWSEAHRSAVALDRNGTVTLISLDGSTARSATPVAGQTWKHLALSPDGAMAALGNEDGTTALWRPTTGQPPVVWKAPHPVRAVGVAGSAGKILTAGSDASLIEWNPDGTATGRTWKAPLDGGLGRCVFAPSGKFAVAAGDSLLSITAALVELGDSAAPASPVVLSGHASRIGSMAVSPDEKFLATGDGDGVLRIWTRAGRPAFGPFHLLRDEIVAIAFSPSVDCVALRGRGNQLVVVSLDGSQLHGPFEASGIEENGIAFADDGLLISAQVRGLRLWSLLGLEMAPAFHADDAIEEITVHPDGSKVCAIDVRGRCVIWNTADRSRAASIQTHVGRGRSASASPDGTCIAATSAVNDAVRFLTWGGSEAAPPFAPAGEKPMQASFAPGQPRLLAVATDQGNLWLLDPMKTPRQPQKVEAAPELRQSRSIRNAQLAVSVRRWAAIFHDYDETKFIKLATGAWDGTVSESLSATGGLPIGYSPYRKCAVVDARDSLITTDGGNLAWWPLREPSRDKIRRMAVRSNSTSTVAVVGRDRLAIGDNGGAVRVVDLDGTPLCPWLQRDQKLISSLCSGSSDHFFSAGRDGRLRTWPLGIGTLQSLCRERLRLCTRLRAPQTDLERTAASLLERIS